MGGGRGFKTGGARLELVCVTAEIALHSPPAFSRSILSLEEPQGRQMHLPEIHTPGQTPIYPISTVLQKHCMCHAHWCPLTHF